MHGSSTLACQLSPDPVVKLDPAGLGFLCRPNTVAGCQCDSPKTATLTNVGGATLGVDFISTSLPFIHTDTCGTSVDAGQSCSISVTFLHPIVLGTLSGELKVTDNAADSPQTMSLSAQVDCIP